MTSEAVTVKCHCMAKPDKVLECQNKFKPVKYF